MNKLLIVVVVAALYLLACSPGGATPTSSAGATPSDQAATSGLVLSQFGDCNQGGQELAAYLRTGQPTTDDPIYGSERQQVLAMSGERRELAIRQYADAYISRCAQTEAARRPAATTPPVHLPTLTCPSGFELSNAGCCPPGIYVPRPTGPDPNAPCVRPTVPG